MAADGPVLRPVTSLDHITLEFSSGIPVARSPAENLLVLRELLGHYPRHIPRHVDFKSPNMGAPEPYCLVHMSRLVPDTRERDRDRDKHTTEVALLPVSDESPSKRNDETTRTCSN